MRKTVLLVSTEPQFFEDPANAFQSRGCDVFTAMSKDAAITFLGDHDVELVIFHGVPKGLAPTAAVKAAGSAHVVLVAPPGEVGDWSGDTNIKVVSAPIEGRKLLRVTASSLNVPDRKYISILVQVRVTRPKATTIFGKSRDLSVGGILVETNQTLLVHDQVVVSFLIPGAERMIQSEAAVMREVIRTGGARRYGLKFITLTDEDAGIIRDFLGGKLTQ